MTTIKKLISKLESADNLVIRIPFDDIKNPKDAKDAVAVAKMINLSPGLAEIKVTDVESVMDGDKKEFRIIIDTESTIKNRNQVIKIIQNIFK